MNHIDPYNEDEDEVDELDKIDKVPQEEEESGKEEEGGDNEGSWLGVINEISIFPEKISVKSRLKVIFELKQMLQQQKLPGKKFKH